MNNICERSNNKSMNEKTIHLFIIYKNMLQNMWLGVLHHVVNKHSWAFGKCQHETLEEPHDPEWLQS